MVRVIFASLMIVPFVTPICIAADWPTYRADAGRSGYTEESLPETLNLRWTHRTPVAPTPAWPSSSRITFDRVDQPIVVEGKVIFGSSATDTVTALNAESGRVAWRFFTGGPVRFAPSAWKDRVFVASDDGCLYALAIADGRLLWKHRGGPSGRMCMGNGRMISRWPARGGPVIVEDTVYYAAGIWPSEGVFLHALDTGTGKIVWSNTETGGLLTPQPHPGAEAASGVSPQGYLVATDERLFVPTGRSVPAAFRRDTGRLEHYLLQENWSVGGSRALITDRFLANAGCLLEQETGRVGARAGRGVLSGLPGGLLRFTGSELVAYDWGEVEQVGRKGEPLRYHGLKTTVDITLNGASREEQQAARISESWPSLATLFGTEPQFREMLPEDAKQATLERDLSQTRPDVEKAGGEASWFEPTTAQSQYEVIAAGRAAICGQAGMVRVVDLDTEEVRAELAVTGTALGLAVADGHLIVSTTDGTLYCYGRESGPAKAAARQSTADEPSPSIDYAAMAEDILRATGVTRGVCVDLGCGSGELALELARRSELHVIGIESDPSKVAEARLAIHAAGLYGNRVTIHCGDPAKTPYPTHVANLIVSSDGLADREEMARLRRPWGGVVCVGSPGKFNVVRSGPLEGAGEWTHQNANAANTLCSDDRVVRGPLETAWYHDGVLEVPDRHAQGPAPLFSQGYLVVEGVHGLCALDAYNGTTVWTYDLPDILSDWDGVHHDVGVGDTGSNFCLSDSVVFVRHGIHCSKIDLATGQLLARFSTPTVESDTDRNWGYVAVVDGVLYGSVLNDAHTISPRYEGIRLRNESSRFFAMDAKSGDLLWKYEPRHSIRNNAIAVAGGAVYLIDRQIAPEDRLVRPTSDGKHGPRLESGSQPGGTLLALDAKDGALLWRNNEDIFGTQLAVSAAHETLLMSYQAVNHGFFRLPSEVGGRLAGLDTRSGVRRWDRAVEYKTRPVLNGEVLRADGGAWNLLTGEDIPWIFKRSYGCGQMAGSTHLMVFRAATLGYLDFTRDVGTENFGGIRTSCWFNAIPAGGMVLVPDGSAKCACSYQMQAWLALKPYLSEGR